MDRRQRKTRESIFKAFAELLRKKDAEHITVAEIIEKADVGRATFYAHFPSKDFLIKELNEELFCHIFDSMDITSDGHRHIFQCDESSVYLHLFKHLQNNDNGILSLLDSPNNELFLKYFKDGLVKLIENNPTAFKNRVSSEIPYKFWVNHLAATFVETIMWWITGGKKESPEEICKYYLSVVNL